MAVNDDCLEGFETENVGVNCGGEDINSGVSDYAYYALAEHVDEIEIPENNNTTSYEECVTIDTAIKMVVGKKFSRIDLQVDLNGLKSNYVGNAGNQKINATYEAFIAGVTAKLVGMQKKLLNKRLIFLIPDNNGNVWLLGTKVKPSRIQTFDIDTGKTDDENNGATVSILSKVNPYLYNGSIPLAVAPEPEVTT